MNLICPPDKPVVKLFEFNGSINFAPSDIIKKRFFRESNKYFTGQTEHPLDIHFDQNSALVKAQFSFVRGSWLKYVGEAFSDGSIKFK